MFVKEYISRYIYSSLFEFSEKTHKHNKVMEKKHFIYLNILIGGVFLMSLAWNIYSELEESNYRIRQKLNAIGQTVFLAREWNSIHGGVYVPITETTLPNPYLDVPDRDIETTDGKKLTLINPAYMTRLISEIATKDSEFYFHFTSLKPLRPENKPDDWETKVMKRFTKGTDSYFELVELDTISFFRYMFPIVVKPTCLKCHAKDGYKPGEIRGGLSVTLNAKEKISNRNNQIASIVTSHVAIYFFVFIVMLWIFKRLKTYTQKLKDSEQKYRQLFSNMPVGFSLREVVFNEEGKAIDYRYIEANPAFEKMTGINAEEIVGKTLLEVFPKTEQYWMDTFADAVRTGEPISYENYTQQLDKHFETLAFSPAKGLFAVFLTDISKRKAVENELKESLDKYRFLTENMKDVVWILDAETKFFKYISPSVEKLRGYTVEEILSQPLGAALTQESFALVENKLDSSLKKYTSNNKIYDYKVHYVEQPCKDGSTVWTEVVSAMVSNPKTGKLEVHGVTRDISARKAFEEKLKESEARFRMISELIHVGIVLSDKNEKVLYINQRFTEMFGYTNEDMPSVNEWWYLAYPDEDYRDMVKRKWAEVISYNNNDNTLDDSLEFKVRCKNGNTLIIEFRLASAEGLNVVSFRDVTERRQAEKALKISEEKYKHLFDFMPFGISLTDKQGNLLENNKEAQKLLGLDKDELERRKIYGDVWHIIRPDGSDMPAEEFASVRALLDSTRVENVVMGIVKKNDETTWITVTAEPFQYGDYGVVVSYLDITKMVLAERKLLENEERLKTIINIFQQKTYSLQEFLDYALNRAVEFTDSKIGYIYFYDDEKREFILNSWSNDVMKECKIVEKQTRYELDKTGIWGEAVRQSKPIIVNDFQAPHPLKKGYPDGHAHLNRFLTVPIFSNDRIVAVAGVANKESAYDEADTLQLILLMDTVWRAVERKKEDDLKKKLFEEIQESKDELETALYQKNILLEELTDSESKLKESLAAKDKFFSIIAHDLRSPFSGFLGLTDIMAKEAEDLSLKEIKTMSSIINDSANSIFKLLNDLLQWSRTQIGTMPFEQEALDLYEIAFNIVFLLKQMADNKRIVLVQNINPGAIAVGDRNMIVTVFRNLVTNAIKFTETGGAIEIGISNELDDDTHIQLFVKDNGIGIEKEEIENLFTIGNNYSRPGTENESGTGLGLILCKEFIERNGGKLWVESEVGKGSVFYFTLPKAINE